MTRMPARAEVRQLSEVRQAQLPPGRAAAAAAARRWAAMPPHGSSASTAQTCRARHLPEVQAGLQGRAGHLPDEAACCKLAAALRVCTALSQLQGGPYWAGGRPLSSMQGRRKKVSPAGHVKGPSFSLEAGLEALIERSEAPCRQRSSFR